jgi:hypothetical protein
MALICLAAAAAVVAQAATSFSSFAAVAWAASFSAWGESEGGVGCELKADTRLRDRDGGGRLSGQMAGRLAGVNGNRQVGEQGPCVGGEQAAVSVIYRSRGTAPPHTQARQPSTKAATRQVILHRLPPGRRKSS